MVEDTALMAMQLPTKRGELLVGVAVTGLSAVLLFTLGLTWH